jgi:hypothetical protein
LQVTGTETRSVAEGNDNYSGHVDSPVRVTSDNYPCITPTSSADPYRALEELPR